MNPPKTPKLEDCITGEEISLSRSELYARLQVEKRHVASLEDTCATLQKENYELKNANAELTMKIDLISEGIGEVVSKAIGDIASGVKSLKAMAYDVGKEFSEKKKLRDCTPFGHNADSTFLLDAIHDNTRRFPPVTPMNTPVIVVPPALRAPIHGSESIRRAQAQVIIETSHISDKQKTTMTTSDEKKRSMPAEFMPQESTIDVTSDTKISPPGGEEGNEASNKALDYTIVNKTPVRARQVDRMSVHPIAIKSVRKPSVEQIKRRTAAPETTVPSKVMRMETSTAATSRPTIQGRGVPNRISLQKKPVAAVTGEGNSRDKMDPALASSISNVITRKVGQSSAPAKADAVKRQMVTKRVVKGGRGPEL